MWYTIFMKSFGIYLLMRMKELNFTQQQLAEALQVSRPLVALWTSGRQLPSRKHIPKLAEVLGISQTRLYHLIGVILEGEWKKDFITIPIVNRNPDNWDHPGNAIQDEIMISRNTFLKNELRTKRLFAVKFDHNFYIFSPDPPLTHDSRVIAEINGSLTSAQFLQNQAGSWLATPDGSILPASSAKILGTIIKSLIS